MAHLLLTIEKLIIKTSRKIPPEKSRLIKRIIEITITIEKIKTL